VENLDRAGGKDPRGDGKMRINCRGVGDQSVERDERRNCRKDRQQRIEDDPSRDSEQSIVIDAGINAPKDVLPALPRNLPRSHRAPSSSGLLRPAQLRRNRLIVLELLSRPFSGLRLRRLTKVARDLAILVRRGIGCPVRLAADLASPATTVCLGQPAARRGDCDKGHVEQNRPYLSPFRHSIVPARSEMGRSELATNPPIQLNTVGMSVVPSQ
jgi:hypothetical protein